MGAFGFVLDMVNRQRSNRSLQKLNKKRFKNSNQGKRIISTESPSFNDEKFSYKESFDSIERSEDLDYDKIRHRRKSFLKTFIVFLVLVSILYIIWEVYFNDFFVPLF